MILDYIRHYGEEALAVSVRRCHHKARQRRGHVGPHAGVAQLVPGFFATEVEESVQSPRSLLRMCFAQEPAADELYLMLGYNISVPPLCVRRSSRARSTTTISCRRSGSLC